MHKKIKILAIVNNLSAVAEVRIISPLNYLKTNGYVDYEIVDLSEEKTNPINYVPDIVILQRINNMVYYNFIKLLKSKGSKIVFELDDNLLELPVKNPSHSLYADANLRRSFLEFIWLADHLIVSTENLKNYYSEFNKSIYVVPNQIDEEIFYNKKVKRTDANNIRIGFAGTITHREDFEQVELALREVQQKYKEKIKLVFFNMIPDLFVTDKSLEFIPGTGTLKEFAPKLNEANFDIGLAPLTSNKFNMAKSDIKFLEYGISGIAGIYSNFGPYKRTIKDNETGLFVNFESSTGWFSKLSYLIENPSEIDRIKKNAFDYVSQKRTLKQNYKRWLDVFSNITGKQIHLEKKIVNIENAETKKNKSQHISENNLVSIIIPVFNKVELTKQCIKSIYSNTPNDHFEIIIVNNGSTDGTDEYLNQINEKDNITIIKNKTNLGFAKANNQAAKIARGKYILLLNNDTECKENWLNPLLEVVQNDDSVGAVGSKLLFPDGTIQHAGVCIINNKKLPDPLVASHIYRKAPGNLDEASKPQVYQALTAACLLVRKSLYLDIGGLDENYWNGYEDIDFCFKLQSRKVKLVYQPNSILIHHESQSGEERFLKVNENISRLHEKWLDKIEPDFIINENGSMSETNAKIIKEYQMKYAPQKNISAEQKISIVIPTYNKWNYTKQVIESIQRLTNLNYEIIIIDNASSDETIEKLKNYNQVKVLSNLKNLGFPKAINRGIIVAKGKYILIANNDIVVTESWLERMVEIAETYPEVGIIGPISNAVSGVQLDQNAKYNSIVEMHKYAQTVSEGNRGQVEEFPRVAFLCTLIKREVIEKIGGLDERFSPGNFEDDDFCLRAQLAGYKTVIAKDIFIHHYGSVSFKQNGENEYGKRLKINEQKFIEKWGSNPEGVWLKGENIKEREIKFPINTDLYVQSLERAFINIDDEEYDFALENLKRALANFKSSARKGYEKITQEDLLNMAGNLALTKNELEEAKTLFEKQLEVNPNSSNACFGLGEVFNLAEMFEESKTMLEWAIINDEDNSNAKIRLGEVNQKLNLPEDHNSLLEQEKVGAENNA